MPDRGHRRLSDLWSAYWHCRVLAASRDAVDIPSAGPPASGIEDSLRIGTWNMENYPLAEVGKGPEAANFLAVARADLWLLTEVNARWQTPGQTLVVSPRRTLGNPQERWAGIQTALPVIQLLDDGRTPAAAEEALCLARMHMPAGSFAPTMLIACSVLPWEGTGDSWPNLPGADFNSQAKFVLDHHTKRIRSARQPGEPLIWGGDFNQALRQPSTELQKANHRTFGTVAGISRLQATFNLLELRALTASAEHYIPGREAIDHLAVSRDARAVGVEVLRPPKRSDGRRLSDHAAYVADMNL